MDSITASKLSQKLKLLPDDLLQEVDKFVDYLKYKSEHNDWSGDLMDNQKQSIKNGSEDISNGKTYSHAEAKQIIKEHINRKIS